MVLYADDRKTDIKANLYCLEGRARVPNAKSVNYEDLLLPVSAIPEVLGVIPANAVMGKKKDPVRLRRIPKSDVKASAQRRTGQLRTEKGPIHPQGRRRETK
uniref:Uncharacterized protein n=1 Tax=Chromera velia CCMP2878 TaxID=1169474 RepID=A0A0G4GDJ6_9ALVE|eukprot:Cvel_4528.t1-p1 / transcript=Cvel_4528.t1 / gene=Cvel_4528 / organism=Chromera_velia_CCMP2878 / gene_product=hypothetical protein / transcript_product=hypothetical protein / location=Cvel_scaffold198:68303-72006(-) / protein_length=101 / sequence_SO=supercontig / SO=protein_coding / is_pseudo=false